MAQELTLPVGPIPDGEYPMGEVRLKMVKDGVAHWTVEPPEPGLATQLGRWPLLSYSSMGMLTACERKWAFRYRDQAPDSPSSAMQLGSTFHTLAGAWWQGGDWEATAKLLGEMWIRANPEAERMPKWFDDAVWLFERYIQVYGHERPDVEVVATELEFKVRLPGKYGWLVGKIDNLWRIDGKLWVTERKTMGDWDRMEAYCWDPQVTLYFWVAQQLGYEPWGICLDAARTYRWVEKNLHKYPPEVSFQRRWLDRNDTHLKVAMDDMTAALVRQRQLLKGDRPIRNVSRDCGWCSFREPCMNELAFSDTGILLED